MNNLPFGFVDANVLAHALIVEKELQKIRTDALKKRVPTDRVAKRREKFLRGYEVGRSSYDLFHILHMPSTLQKYVVTSNLAKLEVIGVIVAEFKCRRLLKLHVPFRHWLASQDKIKLSTRDLQEVQVDIILFMKKMAHAIVTNDEYDLKVAELLITEFGCDTRDAILVATAVANHCPLFITEDERLKRKLRLFKELNVVKAQFAVDSLNQKNSKVGSSPEG